jgi:hypothetical protein
MLKNFKFYFKAFMLSHITSVDWQNTVFYVKVMSVNQSAIPHVT